MSVRAIDVREALRLDRLPPRLAREVRGRNFGAEVIALALRYLPPTVVPLLGSMGVHGLWIFAAAFVFIDLPTSVRATERTQHSDALRLYGPSAASVVLARVIRHAPYLIWVSLCLGAAPTLWWIARGIPLEAQSYLIGSLFASIPCVRYFSSSETDDGGGSLLSRNFEKLALLYYFAVLIGALRLTATASPDGLAAGSHDWVFGPSALVLAVLVSVLRFRRELLQVGMHFPAASDESVETNVGARSVEFGIPSVHRQARSASESDRLLEKLRYENARRRSESRVAKPFLLLAKAFVFVIPFGIGCFCIVVLESRVAVSRSVDLGSQIVQLKALETSLSFLVLWISTILLSASREPSGDEWLRGRDWREQLAADHHLWWTRCFAPAVSGALLGVLLESVSVGSLCALALVLAGLFLRRGLGGFRMLASGSVVRRRVLGLTIFAFGLAGPILHAASIRMSARSACVVATLAALLGVLGALYQWTKGDEAKLGDMWRRERDDEDPELAEL